MGFGNQRSFDPRKFGKAIKRRCCELKLSLREAATITGVSHATLGRTINGGPPDIWTFFKIKNFLEDSAP